MTFAKPGTEWEREKYKKKLCSCHYVPVKGGKEKENEKEKIGPWNLAST